MSVAKYFFEPPADMSTLPEPPVSAGLDLRHFDCMHLNTERLLRAEIWDECSGDEIAAALRLWCEAWRQVPCSSLPNDDKKLRRLAGYEGREKGWKRVRNGAVRGFELKMDGRLYHAVIAETASEASSKSRAGKRGAKAKWDKVNALKNNNSRNATASSKTDDTLYSSGDGRGHGRTDAISMQRREENTLTPLPPPSAAAGSERTPSGPSARPPAPTEPRHPTDPYAHGFVDKQNRVVVHHPSGVIFKIGESGGLDVIDHVKDAVIPQLNNSQALALRNKTLAEREKPPDPRPAERGAELEREVVGGAR